MIRYSLSCGKDHQFESWFASAQAFDMLAAGGHLSCAVCGDDAVTKALMAPMLRTDPAATPAPGSPAQAPATASASAPSPAGLSAPASPMEQALAELRRRIESESDYVGLSFATQARAMHEGEIDHRPIHGEARADEARALIEDGIPIAPLPFLPRRQTN